VLERGDTVIDQVDLVVEAGEVLVGHAGLLDQPAQGEKKGFLLGFDVFEPMLDSFF